MARISSLSKEYIVVPVESSPGGSDLNPGVAVVEFAIIAGGEPEESDWTSGDFKVENQSTFARIVVGPGSLFGALADGVYTVWLRITQSPEVVVRPAGELVVT